MTSTRLFGGSLLGRLTLLSVLTLAGCGPATTPVVANRPLVWGGDREGGAPFIFAHPDDDTRLTGFEVDLAGRLAGLLGRPGEQFQQCQWDQVLMVLSRGDVEIALNGYEFTPRRAAEYRTSLPYYIYQLSLATRRADATITDWDALAVPPSRGGRHRVGVLAGSAADQYVSTTFPDSVTPVRLDGAVEALSLVGEGQLDATVQDSPMLQHYVEHLQRYPDLHVVGQPRSEGYYVIYTRAEDRELRDQLNAALRTLHASGELQAIYARYGIWNDNQAQLPRIWTDWDPDALMSRGKSWSTLVPFLDDLLRAALVTIALAAFSMPLAVAGGLLVALGRSWWTPVLGGGREPGWTQLIPRLLTVYVEVLRGTPLAFQLFVIYFVLPRLGVRINEFWAGVTALAINYSAYESEVFRLGLQSLPKGQLEAALSLGMSRTLAVRRILLPQAVRTVIPAITNDFISLFKDTAVCSVIAVEELSKQYSIVGKSTGMLLETAALTAALYLSMSYPLSLLTRSLERRQRRSPTGAS